MLSENDYDLLDRCTSRNSAFDKKYMVTSEGVIVYGSVHIGSMDLTEIPFKFRLVHGFFNCSGNKLTSLFNSPEWVQSTFNCSSNLLETLDGVPNTMRNLSCTNNNIKTYKALRGVHFDNIFTSPTRLTPFDEIYLDSTNFEEEYGDLFQYVPRDKIFFGDRERKRRDRGILKLASLVKAKY